MKNDFIEFQPVSFRSLKFTFKISTLIMVVSISIIEVQAIFLCYQTSCQFTKLTANFRNVLFQCKRTLEMIICNTSNDYFGTVTL